MHPDLYALVIQLVPERGESVPDAPGHQVQALFFELVRQVEPELANALHADAQVKPFTVAALPSAEKPGRGSRTTQSVGDVGAVGVVKDRVSPHNPHNPTAALRSPVSRLQSSLELRATLAHADLFGPFSRALLQQTARPAMRLGHTALRLGDVYGTPGSHPWAGYSSFAQLFQTTRPTPTLTLEFASATAFGQGSRANGKPRLGLLPTPELVFGSLARRWNELAPPGLELNSGAVETAAADTLVSRFEARSTTINLGKGPQKGFVGTCSYELPSDPVLAHLISLLADAAFYLGLGMKTGRGMGLCRRVTSA
ncbi:MAG: CRISPR system precrRNA processing endoribonuclease RAMP protein Cas6 [Chloroflexaceae bacterium]|jgi:CRISPR-associated endoribonuclease Cas6|nr:CRISPR system precrRNA processing endoribonuclease RAMP protein Cas6 [Chloroflexaceae bacterium]